MGGGVSSRKDWGQLGEVVVDFSEEETCVHCHKKLGYLKGTHVDLRRYYVRGHGDHCERCFDNCPFAKLLGGE